MNAPFVVGGVGSNDTRTDLEFTVDSHRHALVGVLSILEDREVKLLQVGDTGRLSRLLTSLGKNREQNSSEDCDNRNNDE